MTATRRAWRDHLRFLRRFLGNRRGGVLVMFAFAILPLIFSVGMGIDYARAMRMQAKLVALADAAALSAVSKSGMGNTPFVAARHARSLFTAQAEGLNARGLMMDFGDPKHLSVEVHDGAADESVARKASVRFSGSNRNVFASILGLDVLAVAGQASASTSLAPHLDLYVLLDTSPSMLFPATSDGVATMVKATGGCAFACHETANPNNNLNVARANNVVLRTDLVTDAVQKLTALAKSIGAMNGATYRIGIHDFDHEFRKIWPSAAGSDGEWVDADLDRVGAHVGDAKVLAYCRNSERLCGIPDMDTATDFTAAINGINGLITAPGTGSSRAGDPPQAVLLIVTDGMRDEYVPANRERALGAMPSHLCDMVKARNVRIAMLNTKYLPEAASDEWSIENVRQPYLAPVDRITPALQNCASPGLYHQITVDEDISSSLSNLFQKVIRTAHLER